MGDNNAGSTEILPTTSTLSLPTSIQSLPTSSHSLLSTSIQSFPTSTQSLPLSTEYLTTSTRSLPISTESLPTSIQSLSTSTQTLPTSIQSLPLSTESLTTSIQSLSTEIPTKNGKNQENTAAFVIAAIIGIVVIGFFIFLVYKMILKRREDAEKARNAEKLSKITGRPKKTVTFKDEVESDDDVLKNEYTKDDFDSDGSDEDSGIKIDLEEEDAIVGNDDDSISDDQDDELKFDIDEDVGDDDCIKIDIVDVRQKKNADQVKIDLTVS